MRRGVLQVLALLTMAATTLPSGAAEPVRVTHSAPVPCGVACSYWDAAEAAGFDICEEPFPPGSYDKTLFTFTSPTGIIEIAAHSDVDYDTFVCTNTEPSMHVSNWADPIGEECEGFLPGRGLLALGCTEHLVLTLQGLHARNGGVNDEFFVVSYNWSDIGRVQLSLTGPVAVVDDSFEPSLT